MASNANYFTQEKDLFSTVLNELKALGVKVPKIKKFKSTISKQETAISERGYKVFGVSLSEQEWTSEEYPIPKFVAWATAYLQNFIKQEIGLFRKAGNRARQRSLRAKLDRGESIQDADPNDVACLLKQWLRELPESLIPCYLQDLFIRCNSLEVEKDRKSACLFAILLLPPDHMYTLKHILRFLSSISLNSDKNKMGISNLAIVMAPNIFVTNKSAEKMNNLLNDHTTLIQLMIENSDKIGEAPPSAYQRHLLRADLHASVDTLDVGSIKYKRKSGPVQDILCSFKKLVGHNGSFSWKSSSEVHFLDTPKVPRQSLSLVNLDSPNFVTPKEKEDTVKDERKSTAHARRKSFGALLLRKKDRKRPEDELRLLEPEVAMKSDSEKDLAFTKNSKNIADLTDSSSNFSNLNLSATFNKKDHSSSRNSKEIKSRKWSTTEDIVIEDVTVKKPVVKYSKSCKLQITKESEIFKTPLPPSTRISTLKSENKKDKQLGRFGLSRQEAFSIKPIKENSYLKYKNTDKENVQVKTTQLTKSSNNTCSHSQTSACNTKCDKNKSGNCERRVSEKRIRQESCTRSHSQTQKKKSNTEPVLQKSGKVSSRASSSTAISQNISETPDSVEVSENNGVQSLDLSLKLLLQNFCMSPPNGSSEIKVSIDIEASNSNPELKLNISQKENQQNNTSVCKTHQTSRSTTKTRPRLSSQSDSKIPRLKNLHRPNRQSSFSGTVTESKRRTPQLNEKSQKSSTKIPVAQNTSDPVKESSEMQNDSCFLSPNSESWVDGTSKYWSPPTSPTDEICSKRESVAKILKEKPGHVQAKVSLYSKLSDSSDTSESVKITRSASEKYPRKFSNNKSKLCASRSCSSNQTPGLGSKSYSQRSLLKDFSKLAQKEFNTSSSPNLLKEKKNA